MTNEQAKEILRCNTNLGNGVIIENESTQAIYEALNMAIKALEQTTSDDCVSREKVWYMITGGKYPNEDYEQFIERLVKELENMSPVTPTHGTCKDCKHWKDSDGVYRRGIGAESKCPINIKEVYEGNFYCKDFEKRGSENE